MTVSFIYAHFVYTTLVLYIAQNCVQQTLYNSDSVYTNLSLQAWEESRIEVSTRQIRETLQIQTHKVKVLILILTPFGLSVTYQTKKNTKTPLLATLHTTYQPGGSGAIKQSSHLGL